MENNSLSRIQQLNDELVILEKEVVQIKSEMNARLEQIYTRMNPLRSELKSLLPPDPKIVEYIMSAIDSLKELSIDIDEDAIKSIMLTNLKELPEWNERKEDGKYYDPSWTVDELQYQWGDELIKYEQWSLWVYPDETPVYSNTSDDAENIRSLCEDIKDGSTQAFNKLDKKYIPILMAFIDEDFK